MSGLRRGIEILHGLECIATLYMDAEEDRLAFQIYPYGYEWNGDDHTTKVWDITVERVDGVKLKQGQYSNVATTSTNNLRVRVKRNDRGCQQAGNAEIRIIDTTKSGTSISLNKFKVDFELGCYFHTQKMRGSFTFNWDGDKPFKLNRSQLRATSPYTYGRNSWYERNAVDGVLGSYWLSNANYNSAFRSVNFTVSQTGYTPYRLSHMNVIFYSDYYRPDYFYHSANDGTTYTAGWMPAYLFEKRGTSPGVMNIDLGGLKLPRIDMRLYGSQYFQVIREVEVYAQPPYSRWTNQANPCDVNADGFPTAGDALKVINYSNRVLASTPSITLPEEKPLDEHFYDVTGEGVFNGQDLLAAANCLGMLGGF
jgi:hypothetical protein